MDKYIDRVGITFGFLGNSTNYNFKKMNDIETAERVLADYTERLWDEFPWKETEGDGLLKITQWNNAAMA